jgi:hypothetical protein
LALIALAAIALLVGFIVWKMKRPAVPQVEPEEISMDTFSSATASPLYAEITKMHVNDIYTPNKTIRPNQDTFGNKESWMSV